MNRCDPGDIARLASVKESAFGKAVSHRAFAIARGAEEQDRVDRIIENIYQE